MASSISDGDKRELQAIGAWTVGLKGPNKRTVSGAMLSPPSSSDSSLSSSSSVTVVFRDETGIVNCDFDICMEQESVDALVYIGFSQDPAQEIWDRYLADDPNSPYDLIGYVSGHIESCDIDGLSDRDALTKMGLSTDFKDRMLNPNFFAILRTRELKSWVFEFLEGNFLTIGIMLERSRNWAGRSFRAKSDKKSSRKSLGEIDWNPKSDTGSSRPGSKSLSAIDWKPDISSQRGGGSKPTSSKAGSSAAASSSKAVKLTTAVTATAASMQNTLDDFHLPSAQVEIISAQPQKKPGHVVIYKAIPGLRCKGWLQSDGSIDVGRLTTSKGGDFNGRKDAWYWTQELATAIQYRNWQSNNQPNSDLWIISLQVPADWVKQTFKFTTLKFSNPWKYYVWCCKSRLKARPQDQKFADSDWITGHICTGKTYHVTNIPQASIESAMGDEFLLKNGGDRATQECIMNEKTMEQVFQKAGKPHVEVWVPSNPKGARKSKGKGKATS